MSFLDVMVEKVSFRNLDPIYICSTVLNL